MAIIKDSIQDKKKRRSKQIVEAERKRNAIRNITESKKVYDSLKYNPGDKDPYLASGTYLLGNRYKRVNINQESRDNYSKGRFFGISGDYKIFNEFCKELSEETGYSVEMVKRVWYNMFEFIIETINSMPSLFYISQDNFNKLQTYFTIGDLGKFDTSFPIIQTLKNRPIIKKKIGAYKQTTGKIMSHKQAKEILSEEGKLFTFDKDKV